MRDFISRISPALREIWKFAKKKTALFLGLCTAAISVITVFLNLTEYCYNLGYYHYAYDVPTVYLKYSNSSSISGTIVISIVIVCLFLVYTLIGYDAYRECKTLRFWVATLAAVMALFIIPMIIDIVNSFSLLTFIVVLLQYIILAIFLIVLLNSFLISLYIFPTKDDKLARSKIKLKKVKEKIERPNLSKKKQTKLSGKKNKLDLTIEGLETKVGDSKGDGATRNHQADKEKKVAETLIVAMVVLSVVALCAVLVGLIEAEINKDYTVIVSDDSTSSEMIGAVSRDVNANMLVVLFQNDNEVIVSPCYVVDGEITIYEEYQQALSSERLIFYHGTYNTVR